MNVIGIIPGFIAVAGILSLWLWLNSEPARQLEMRIPGTDNVVGEEPLSQVVGDVFSGKLIVSDGIPANIPGAWPRFGCPFAASGGE